MIAENVKEWFIGRVSQDPEYLRDVYLPAMERLDEKALAALFQTIRNGTIEDIKYRMGWLDGVREAHALLGGLKLTSEARKPAGTGLMSRIFGSGQSVG